MYNREDLIVRAATLYYEEKMTQQEIAKSMHISRPTVSHMLNEAREKGIVNITINHPDSSLYSLQNKILAKYKLDTVYVVNNSMNNIDTKKDIGKLCAQFIESNINDYSKLGIGWGTTIYEYVNQATYTESEDLEIIPLIGGFGIQATQYHSNHLAFRLSEKYNCNVSYFYAPAFAESKEVRDLFKSTVLYDEIYKKGLNVDLAILGTSSPLESSTYKALRYFSKEEEDEIRNSGAIGDILGSFFDVNGKNLKISITERMTGITLDDISRIPEILILASGKEKALSIMTLLNMNIVNHLFIDKEIAESLV